MALRNYAAVASLDELDSHCTTLIAAAKPIAIDIETGYAGADREKAAVHPETAFIVGLSFTNNPLWARYVPIAHDTGDNLDPAAVARRLWPVVRTGLCVAHNFTFELRHLARFFMQYLADDPDLGEQVRAARGYFPIRSDTQVEAYLAAEQQRFGLKALTKLLFGHEMTEIADLFPDLKQKQLKALRFNTLELTPKVVSYACEDAAWCLSIHEKYYETVSANGLFAVEKYLVEYVLPQMEDFGVQYAWDEMRRVADELSIFRDRFNAEIMAELSELVGQPVAVNLASPPQIGKILYEQLGLVTTVYTASTKDKPRAERKMSTGAIALANLAKQHGVVKRILQWKEMSKLLGTYLEKYERQYNYAEDGRAHPNHLSAFVVTGRFAVSDPPYQQSPKDYHFDLAEARAVHAEHDAAHGAKCGCDEYTPPAGTCFLFKFRDVIVAPPGHYILGFDLSQAELRAIAGEARETALLKAFDAGDDVHTLTAALMLGKAIEDVTKDDRAIGKTMNFALLYGMGVKSLADRLAIPVDQAQRLYDKYFLAFPNIAAWSRRQVTLGRRQGYVTSRFGRRLPIWEFLDERQYMQQKGERACVNYPIQGAATGDYMKIAMVRAHQALKRAGLLDRVHLVMNVHDALEFYVDQELLPQEVIRVLAPAVLFPVPGWPAMVADWHLARSWGSPQEITVAEDGTLSVMGRPLDDVRPHIEVDEDTGEEIEAMPDVDPEQLARAAGPAGALLITLPELPTEEGWAGFRSLVDAHPGLHRVVVQVPQGEVPLGVGTALTAHDADAIAFHLGPADISFEPA